MYIILKELIPSSDIWVEETGDDDQVDVYETMDEARMMLKMLQDSENENKGYKIVER